MGRLHMSVILGLALIIWIVAFFGVRQNRDVPDELHQMRSRISILETRAASKAQMDVALGDLTSIVNKIETDEIPKLIDGIHGSNTCLDEIFKRLTEIENQQKDFARRLAARREVFIKAERPLPVEMVPRGAPVAKNKTKAVSR